MKILLVLFLCLLYPFVLFSQPLNSHKPSEKITFEHINEDDGLSNNRVTCILQDSKGYMWIGTQNGLNKYDGYKFTIYKNDALDLFSIKQNHISAIYEDKSGILWSATREKYRKGWLKSSLNRYNYENEQFVRYFNNPSDINSLPNSYISSICEYSTGILLISTKSGVSKFDYSNNHYKLFIPQKSDQTSISNRINILHKMKHGIDNDIWLGTENGLFFTNNKFNKFKKYNHNPKNPFSLSMRSISTMCEDLEGNLWLGTSGGGLNKFNKSKQKFLQYKNDSERENSLISNHVISLYVDSQNIIWIGTKNGLNKFNSINQNFIYYQHEPNIPYSLSKGKVITIYEDKSGVIWIGTEGGGISKINKQIDQFTQYRYNPQNKNSISNNQIWSVLQDKDEFIWFGTNNGLNRFDILTEQFKHYRYNPRNVYSISNNRIWSIHEDDLGNMWIGTWGGGLNRFNRKTGKFKHYRYNLNDPNSLINDYVRLIYEDSENNLWIGSQGGLSKYDYKNDIFKNYKHNTNEELSISGNKILSLLESKYFENNELWIGTLRKGLYKFDYNSEKFFHYENDPKNPKSLSNNNVWLIYEDIHGELWCSTLGGLNRFDRKNENFIRYKFDFDTLANDVSKVIVEDKYGNLWVGNNIGLHKYDRKNNKFIHFNEKYGLPIIRIDAIIEDDNGFLWLSCDKYIIKFNPKSESSLFYKVQNSLKNHVQIQSSYIKGRTGEIVFGGQNGFIIFEPSKIKDNEIIPKINLTDFQIFNNSVEIKKNGSSKDENLFLLDKHISETKIIKIPYDKNVFSLEFAALDYREPSKNKYAYKLDGVDPDWVYTDASRRFATYNQLNPGEYIFHVKGSNNDGIWNDEGKSLKIIITPLWWQTVIFKIFVIMIIVGIIGWIFYYRINALKKKHQVQEEFSRKLIDSQEIERKRIASSLHDSHGQNLLVISNEMQYFTKEHNEYKNELQPVTNIIQESIDEIREISYALHPHQLDKLGLVKTIKSMFNKVSGSTDIKFDLTIDNIDYVFEKKIEINIYRIIQEATNNIIKHSEASEVRIDIKKKLESVEILINDNGKGFDKDEKLRSSTGLGLSGIHERVNLINGKLAIESQEEKGTQIAINIPLK